MSNHEVEHGMRKSLTGSIAKCGLPAPKHGKKCQKPRTNDSFGDSLWTKLLLEVEIFGIC